MVPAEEDAVRERVAAGLLRRVRASLAAEPAALTPGRVAAAVGAEAKVLGDQTTLDTVEAVRRDLTGAGPLEPLLADPEITDVLVQGPNQVWVDRGTGLEPAPVRFPDDAAVRRLAQRLAAAAGRRLDDSAPHVDARLPDRTRLHAVLAPVSVRGTCLSLRVPATQAFTLDDLVAAGTVPVAGARLLHDLVSARLAFLVTGGTGSGKTTLLATLLSLVPATERLVVVEDSGELAPDHPHVVQLEARPPNAEGVGEISVRTLVRQALRMRPDRLIVGEARGGEIVDLLAALNTGHEGGCGTLHANTAADVPARVEALGVAGGLTRAGVHSQLAAAVHAVIQVARGRDGRRRVERVCVLRRDGDGLVVTEEAARHDAGRGVWRTASGMDRLGVLLEGASTGDTRS